VLASRAITKMAFSGAGAIFGATASSTVADTNSSNQRAARADDKQTCLPATVRMIQDAALQQQAEGSSDLSIHELQVGVVTLAGVVEKLNKHSANLEFILNDATGRVIVKHYLSDNSSSILDSITSGAYVSAVGSVRTSPSLHVSTLQLCPLETADAISYHMIEAAHAAVKLLRANGRKVTEPTTPDKRMAKADASESMLAKRPHGDSSEIQTPHKVAHQEPQVFTAPHNVVDMTVSAPQDLRARILDVLRREGEGKEQGVHLDTLVQHLKSGSRDDVQQEVGKLMDAGDVYPTISDEHFAAM